MAKQYIGVDVNGGFPNIVISSSTTSLAIEVVIDDTKISNKADACKQLELLADRIAVSPTWTVT